MDAGKAVVVCLLAAWAVRGRAVLSQESAFLCKRLDAPKLTDGERALYNPSAVWHDEHGWVVFFRHDQCHPGYSQSCPIANYTTQPYISHMGRNSRPDPLLLERNIRAVHYSRTVKAQLKQLNSSVVHVGDLRCRLFSGSNVFLLRTHMLLFRAHCG